MKKRSPQLLNLIQYCIACICLLFLTGSVLGHFYLQGGASYWPSFEPPRTILSGFPFDNRETTSVDRQSDLWIGAGYSVNEEWSFEAFFSKLPSTEATIDLFTFFGGRPVFPSTVFPESISISTNTDTTIIGVGAVYDFYVSDRFSLVGKAGLAFTEQDSEIDLSLPIFRFPTIDFGDDDFFGDVFDDDFYFDDDELFDDDESTLDLYFAVGIRLPIQDTRASVTATYQFVNTPDNSETGLFVGIRWDL